MQSTLVITDKCECSYLQNDRFAFYSNNCDRCGIEAKLQLKLPNL